MPYPPPPPPPDVGEFQAIGLLPAPQLPDVTGHGGEFLETDGIIPQWEPVSGVLPDQTGHGGEFLTTNGTVASWATVPATLPSQTGKGGLFLTTDGSAPSWAAVPGGRYDVTRYGAVADDQTVDSYPAFVAAIAAWTETNSFTGLATTGQIYAPGGTYYFSQPLVLPGYCELFGDGKTLTVLSPGVGNASTPSLVQSFSGPLLYVSEPINKLTFPLAYPQYGASLVGVGGQSMVLDPLNPATPTPNVLIGDSWPWTTFLDAGPTALALEFWVNLTSTTVYGPIIGSMGPFPWSARYYNGQYDIAVQVYSFNTGSGIQIGARITTTNEQQLQVTSAVLSAGSHNVEIDFGGGNFDLYIDGVRAQRVSATGSIVRRPWENASIGTGGVEWSTPFSGPTGRIDSIRLSKVVRHSANFTPPSSKYTADSNTVWLCNFDQGDAPGGNQPFVLAQSVTPSSPSSLIKHYCRLGPTPFASFFPSPYSYVHDIGFLCRQATAGVVAYGAYLCRFDRLRIDGACNWGAKVCDNTSFYTQLKDIHTSNTSGYGIGVLGDLDFAVTAGDGIGLLHKGGRANNFQDQPNNASFMSMTLALIDSAFSQLTISDSAVDSEQPPYGNYRTSALFWVGTDSSMTSLNNIYDASGVSPAVAKGVVMYFGAGHSVHVGDSFFQNPNTGLPYPIEWAADAPPNRRITLVNCKAPYNALHLPLAKLDTLVNSMDSGSNTGMAGLSTSVVEANNLAGTFYVTHGFTKGVALFTVPEPDTSYVPVVTFLSYSGSAPAAGSTIITGITNLTTGFEVTVSADPGGTCELVFSYHLIRIASPALFIPEPGLPDTVSNPLAGEVDTDFAVGFTLVPVGANSFSINTGLGEEDAVEAGTTPGADSWQVSIANAGAIMGFEIAGQGGFPIDAYVSSSINGGTGQLRSMLTAGSHQVAITYQSRRITLYIDNEPQDGIFTGVYTTQPANILIGQHVGGTNLLASATIRNFKVGRVLSEVISGEPDVGPGTMTQSAFFGDDLTLGLSATTGSYASQVTIAKYGTYYYWNASKIGGRYRSVGGYVSGILSYFWQGWGTHRALDSIVLLAGYWDLVTGSTGADIWADLQAIIEGGTASSTFTPNTQNSYAWAHLYAPNIPSVPGSFTLQGVLLSLTGNADTLAGSNTLKSMIDGTPALAAIVTTQVLFDAAQPGGGRYYVNVQAIVPGSAGNAITLTYDGGGGELLWSGPDTTGISLGQGADATVTITPAGGSPVVLLANFDTDADTTVNNLIALFNAEPTLTAVATATLVNHEMLVTANTAGATGNLIGVTRNNVFTQHWTPTPGPGPNNENFLNGGYDGAVENGIPNIIVCTTPPFGTNVNWTSGIETERNTLNGSIRTYCGGHPAVTLADADITLRDAGAHQNLNAAYDSGNGYYINDAGQTALYGLINPLLP